MSRKLMRYLLTLLRHHFVVPVRRFVMPTVSRLLHSLGPTHDVFLHMRGIIWSAMILFLIAIGVYAFVYETFSGPPNVEIEPIHVPDRLVTAGVTPRVAALHLIDHVDEIHRAADSGYEFGRMTPAWPKHELDLPATGVSFQAMTRYLRSLFATNPTTVVSGELIDIGREGHLSLHLRFDDEKVSEGKMTGQRDRVFEQGARHIVETVHPYALAAYYHTLAEYAMARKIALLIIKEKGGTESEIWALNLLGVLAAREAQYSDAYRYYKRAIRLRPEFAVAYNNWGAALFDVGEYDGAIDQYETAIKLRPGSAATYLNWGDALFAKGDYEGAITKYKKSVELKPGWGAPHFNWGNALFFQGNYKDAKAKYETARELDPVDYGYLEHRVETL